MASSIGRKRLRCCSSPTLANRLVSLSTTYRKDGWYPSALEGIEGLSAAAFAGMPVEKAFKEHTPDATAFDALVILAATSHLGILGASAVLVPEP